MTKAAKRRKKEEDEEFEIPAFDETAYMEKEINAAKVSFTIIALAIPLAVILWGLTVVGLWGVGFLLAFASTFLLPRVLPLLPWPKLDLSKFERRDWIGHGGIFFFAWLAFWILLLNVPFTDLTPPTIAAVYVNGVAMRPGEITPVEVPGTIPGVTVNITATVYENVDLRSVQLFLPSPVLDFAQDPGEPRIWRLTFTPTQSTYNGVSVVATDVAGSFSEFSFDITFT